MLGLILAACGGQTPSRQTASQQDIKKTNALLEQFGQQELLRSPEASSRLGLHADRAGYYYSDKLDDRSQAAFERARLARLEMLEQMEHIDPQTLPTSTRVTFEVAEISLTSLVEMAAFGHGQTSLGFSRPYAADQLSGAYIDLPDLFINRQLIRNKREAIAYIDRLSQMADAIDDDGRRLLTDARAGVRPPEFILDRMISLIDELRDPATEPENENTLNNIPSPETAHPIVVAFDNLSLGLRDIEPDERRQMVALVEQLINDDIAPAYARFEKTVRDLKADASQTPGIWAARNGDDYYKAALRFYAGETLDPHTLHQEGLQIVERLNAEIDIALQEAGLFEGSIYERLDALNTRPDQLFENTPEGKTALLESLKNRIEITRAELPRLIKTPPRAGLRVAAIPDFLAVNAPGAYYAAAPVDGTVPAIFYINLRDTKEWPAYTLPTLFYHEAIPGHHFESALTSEKGNMPILRQLIWLPVYGEGWALYAEDLAAELGVYKDDPLGQVGYLQSLMFRAARLVTDTGLHHKRWSREQAVDYLVQTTGQSRTAMENEVDRYTVWPGQAVSYMVGRQFIWKLRQRSKDALGDRFNLPEFHDIILSNGPRPLTMVEADVGAWLVSQTQ